MLTFRIEEVPLRLYNWALFARNTDELECSQGDDGMGLLNCMRLFERRYGALSSGSHV